ncbi:uncharacterized protein LOC116347454 [Contarinia nasturtii]|uniref:uncharacterized protein LOC116347454 n=1 Tax=Contarinia nasturtii TaxID=265458 RepID=UPI0012D3A663|nr:uncharacterized protein LOC116347454 [Contarinia nasturtii]
MNIFNFLSIVISAIFIIASTQQVCALKCWRCSSDASNSAFCNEPFDASNISEHVRRYSYVECTDPPAHLNQRAVCKKSIIRVNGKPEVFRACYWEKVGAAKDECVNDNNTPSYIKREFCETCDTNGCNSVDSNEKQEQTKDKPHGF